MRAAPLVDIKIQNSPSLNDIDNAFQAQILPTGFPTTLVSSFKNDVLEALSARKKVLYMKFEVLSKNGLIDALQNGCRVLQLTCCYVEKDCLCVEGPYGTIERIPFGELRDIFSSKTVENNNEKFPVLTRESTQRISVLSGEQQNESKFVDVLILAVKNNPSLVDLFIKLKIPHIIAFDFKSNIVDFRHKTYEDECIERFCIHFYEELVSQRSISDAYKLASMRAFDDLDSKYFEGRPGGSVSQIIGSGPSLFPKDSNHSEVLFSQGHSHLSNGKIDDISTSRCLTNIDKMLIPFTGRNQDLYEVMKTLCENPGFLKVTGPPGIGKTAFVLQLGYHMLSRNMFLDGVFYIPLKKLKFRMTSEYGVNNLLRETLGLDVQLGFFDFFKSKKMLLIFDNFDLLYTKDIEFPTLFFQALKDCKIACIVVTTTNCTTPHQKEKKGHKKKKSSFSLAASQNTNSHNHNLMKKEIDEKILEKDAKWTLKGLSEEELALMMQSLLNTDNHNNFVSLEELKKCYHVTHAQGNPKFVMDRLREGRIEVQKKSLKVSSIYEQYLNFEEKYLSFTRTDSSTASLTTVRADSTLHVELRHARTQSAREVEGFHYSMIPNKNAKLTKEKSHDGLISVLKKNNSFKNRQVVNMQRRFSNTTLEDRPRRFSNTIPEAVPRVRSKKVRKMSGKDGKRLSHEFNSSQSEDEEDEEEKEVEISNTTIDENIEDEKIDTTKLKETTFKKQAKFALKPENSPIKKINAKTYALESPTSDNNNEEGKNFDERNFYNSKDQTQEEESYEYEEEGEELYDSNHVYEESDGEITWDREANLIQGDYSDYFQQKLIMDNIQRRYERRDHRSMKGDIEKSEKSSF